MQFYTGTNRDTNVHWSKNITGDEKLTGQKIEWIYDSLH